jgi:flagellar basal body P-ring formation protein FlgA
MIWKLLALALIALPDLAAAQTVIANRALRSKTVITEADVSLIERTVPGAFASIEDTVGLETRVTIYAGRPVREGELGPPAVVERNSLVTIRYRSGALSIEADGKALDRGGIGDVVDVMNLSSRTTITGVITEPGTIEVSR